MCHADHVLAESRLPPKHLRHFNHEVRCSALLNYIRRLRDNSNLIAHENISLGAQYGYPPPQFPFSFQHHNNSPPCRSTLATVISPEPPQGPVRDQVECLRGQRRPPLAASREECRPRSETLIAGLRSPVPTHYQRWSHHCPNFSTRLDGRRSITQIKQSQRTKIKH
jgi:hypothetical protein